MLSSTEAVASAKAAKIIADLRNVKTAALAWYMDNIDQLDGTDIGRKSDDVGKDGKEDLIALNADSSKYMDEIKKYLSGSDSEIDEHYQIMRGQNNVKEWFVVYADPVLDSRVKYKLKARAKSVGLLKEPRSGSPEYGDGENLDKATTNWVDGRKTGQWVFMRVK